jgi:hypothetical protein
VKALAVTAALALSALPAAAQDVDPFFDLYAPCRDAATSADPTFEGLKAAGFAIEEDSQSGPLSTFYFGHRIEDRLGRIEVVIRKDQYSTVQIGRCAFHIAMPDSRIDVPSFAAIDGVNGVYEILGDNHFGAYEATDGDAKVYIQIESFPARVGFYVTAIESP